MADPNQPPDDFFNQFLDDYFAECEEHLAVVRRGLLSIEHFVGRPEIDTAQLDELFRSFHTMKGISGMVGLTQAEQLAHEMESYLRVLRQGEARLTKDGFDALLDGTRLLGDVVEAHRVHSSIPDIANSVVALSYAVNNSKTDSAPKQVETATNLSEDKREWRVLFVPSKERSEAGINVNTVRSHLSSRGEIIRTTPLVDKGDVAFEFVLATAASESDLADLREQGVTFSLIERTPATVSGPSHSQTPMASVRVDLARLDQLMLQVGELVVTRARLEQGLKSIRTTVGPSSWRQLQEINVALGKQLRDLRNDVMRVRMVPIAEVFERMRFVVRDVAKETQKRVDLELSGQETEIDKFLVERLMDPLLHLVRNSISHGIESEEERVNAGKTAVGHVFIRAQTSGELVVIEIGDDGRGIDVEAIEESLGRELQTTDGEINFSELLKVISEPGFSTRKHADRASGRGVGMDVVSRSIKDLDGHLSMRTEPGVGTTFQIELPLTLAIADALIATVAGQTFAIHRSSVQEVIEVDADSVKVFENNEIIIHREDVLPLVRLSSVFNLQGKKQGLLNAFVIGTGAQATALVVDKVLGLREVVVRSLPDPLTAVPGVAGATELGDGKPVLILDIGEILDSARHVSISPRT